MPYGRWPERVKDFRKWASEKVDKGTITDRATGSGRRPPGRSRYRSTTRKRKKATKEE